MQRIEYLEKNESELDLIGPLWEELMSYHKNCSHHFKEHYSKANFELRKKSLVKKSAEGTLYIDMAKNSDTGEFVGYCISSVSKEKTGEIDSLYVKTDYRRFGIGDNLMKRALSWMDSKQANRKILSIGAGNEETLAFYARHNFYPKHIILEQL